ncbi:uncharacterized protein BKA55DRAFT_562648 [Fusarium redolens]|uniref:Uncharacterized protein n=1 Tax=Fusarium redolens TaxID=48865 RepID=A0A9P9HLE2_FUSRE|nr:uncharacterized protein BKA55DRAFT_562648 [Fusarium redolens]KAH7259501.1 hypothetical protein BKA55DRAFT_562648 [Fusarium redolens]
MSLSTVEALAQFDRPSTSRLQPLVNKELLLLKRRHQYQMLRHLRQLLLQVFATSLLLVAALAQQRELSISHQRHLERPELLSSRHQLTLMMIPQPLKLPKRLQLRRLLLRYPEAMSQVSVAVQPALQEQCISHLLHLASQEQLSSRLPLVMRIVACLRLEPLQRLRAHRRLVVATSPSTLKLREQLVEHSTSHLTTQKSRALSSLRHYLVMPRKLRLGLLKAQSLQLLVAESIPRSSAVAQSLPRELYTSQPRYLESQIPCLLRHQPLVQK